MLTHEEVHGTEAVTMWSGQRSKPLDQRGVVGLVVGVTELEDGVLIIHSDENSARAAVDVETAWWFARGADCDDLWRAGGERQSRIWS